MSAGVCVCVVLACMFSLCVCVCDLVVTLHCRSQRLQFDVSSPNGILLFRETSKMITTYGEDC